MPFWRKNKQEQRQEQANPLRVLSKDAQVEFARTLQEGEENLVVLPGEWESAMVATSKRIYVFKKGMMGGVARGQRMSTWEYPAINGVSAEYGKNTGWIALQTQGAAVSDLSFYGSGANSPAQAPNAIAITKKVYEVVQPGVSALRDVVTERQQAPV